MNRTFKIVVLLFLAGIIQLRSQNFDWAKCISGTNIKTSEITKDVQGNNYIIGEFASNITLDTIGLISSGELDIFFAKFDPSGRCVWAKKAGGISIDEGKGITIDNMGNIYITGSFRGIASFDSFQLESYISSSYTKDIFVAKYSPSGHCLWAVKAGGPAQDQGHKIKVTVANKLYVFGTFDSQVFFGGHGVTSRGYDDCFLTLLDSAGQFVWAKGMGSEFPDIPDGFRVDGNGNCYVNGMFLGSALFDNISISIGNNGYHEIFLAKYDQSGTCIWAKAMGSTSQDYSGGVVNDEQGNLYLSGFNGGFATFDTISVPSEGGFLVKYNNNGKSQWVKSIPGGRPTALDIDTKKNTFVVGEFSNTLNIGDSVFTSTGYTDLFFTMFDSTGKSVWANKAGSPLTDRIFSLSADKKFTSVGEIPAPALFGDIQLSCNNAYIADIKNSYLKVNSPNGGEYLKAGTQVNITWDTYTLDTVKLEYSSNNGSSWNLVTQTAHSGSYIWTIPQTSSNQCKIRLVYEDLLIPTQDESDSTFAIYIEGNYSLRFDGIDDYVGNMIEDKVPSNGPFTVEAWVKLENPNYFFTALINRGPVWSYNLYHENAFYWGINDTQPPTYVNYPVSEVNIWHHIAGTKSNDGTINLFIDGVKVASKNYVTGTIPSSTFDLQFGRYLGGGFFLKGWMTKIRISKISRYSNNFIPSTSYSLDTNVVGQWDFNTGVGNALFDISPNQINGTIYGGSAWSTDFPSLATSSILLTSPNGGEDWAVGSSHNITWSQTGVTNVKLEYTSNNGTSWNQIIASTSATTGSYSWTIPNSVSTTCKVRITDVSNSFVTDQSDAVFAITNIFEEVTSLSLPGLEHSATAWADYNNDGNVDLILTGQTNSGNIAKVYKNIGDGTFTEQSSIVIAATASASVHWGDFNNDNYPDLLISGFNSDLTGWMTKVYKNVNGASFTEIAPGLLQSVHNGSSRWGDYDNDGDLDILLTGGGGLGDYFAKVYRNNGNETFSELSNLSLTGVNSSTGEWGDYDNDGDLDILMTGYSLEGIISRIYRNEGGSTFSHQTQIVLPGVWQGTAIWGDYNNDSFLDISLTGKTTEASLISKIYRNNGDNTFTEQVTIPFEGVYLSSNQWGDFNNDGSNDFIISGWNTSEIEIAKFYKNNGNNTFTDFEVPLQAVKLGSMAAADYNNDGSLDILVSGLNNSDRYTKLYQNRYPIPNSPPVQPSDLISNIADGIVNFSWSKSTDDHTLQDGINYNIAIGNSPGIYNIVSPMADKTTGKRSIARMGNCQTNSWHIKGLLPGTYYWSVQAIDGSYLGSQFAQEQSFTIPQTGNYSLYFDGSDDYVGNMIENKIIDTSSFTIEYWAKLTNHELSGLVTRGDFSSCGWDYNFYSSNNVIYFGTSSQGYVSYSTPNYNEWHHFAAVKYYDGSIALFIDGIQVSSASSLQAPINSCYILKFGRYFNDSYFLKGNLTRIRISKIPRYSSNFMPPISYSLDANTVGQWDFTEGVGTVLSDATSNQINGTIYGGAVWSTDFPTLATSSILLNSPNGGENLTVGSTHNITWTQSGVTNVKLEYTTNNGTSWTQIVASTSATTGSYSWTIPNSVSTTCKVRITDVSNSSVTDQSDNSFSINLQSPGNYSLYFDGLDDYVGNMIEDKVPLNGQFTVEAWIKLVNIELAGIINRGPVWSYNLYYNNGENALYWGISDSEPPTYINYVVPNINTWHHVAGTKSNDGTINLFIDGVKVASKNYVGVIAPTVDANLQFGKYFEQTFFLKGWMTRIRISKIARYSSNFSPPVIYSLDTNTVGQWDFAEGTGTVLSDASSNQINGTIYGGATWSTDFPQALSSITVTSPNGGENWQVGSSQNITWSQTGITNVKLEFTTNNGTSWIQIVSSTPASVGSYSWTIPNAVSTFCKVRVTDVNNSSVTDESNSTFSIIQPPVGNYSLYFDGIDDYVGNMIEDKVLSNDPFTVEAWIKLENPNFMALINRGPEWSYNLYHNNAFYWGIYDQSPIYINYVVPNFNAWHHIAGTKSNDGTINLFIDGIKVASTNYVTGTILTVDANLQFGKYFGYVNEMLLKGWMTKIRISKVSRYSSNFTPPISYSLDANTIGQWDFTEGSGSVLSDATSNQINGTIYGGATWSTDFPTSTTSSILLTSPNGGENWTVGSSHHITWTQTGVANVKLEFTSNNGTSWNQIIASTSATIGSYSWTIPNSVSTTCKIRITDVSNSSVTDQSDNSFSIIQPPVGNYSLYFDGIDDYVGNMVEDKVPANGPFTVEAWIKLENQNFMALINRGSYLFSYNLYVNNAYYWGINDNEPPTYINYAVPNLNNWHHIAGTKTDDGKINLFIDGVMVVSQNYATGIIPTVSVDLHFGRYFIANNFLKGWMTKIRISKGARYSSNFTPPISYSLDANTVGQWDFTEGSGTVLSDASTNQINGTIYGGATWSTDFPTAVSSLTITSPNGGENWTVGSTQNITWTQSGVTNVKLEYTSNNGTSWNQITASTSATTGTYYWTIPNSVSTTCRVKITDVSNSSITDQSNAVFTISAAPVQSITVTSPNGGENWTVGTSHNITWSQTGVTNVKLEYTSNSGISWNQIVTSTSANTGSYSWTIPNTASTNCKVRVTDVNNSSVTDQSNAVFTISAAPAQNITVTSPNGGENWQVGSSHNITWTLAGVINVKLEFTTDNGLSWFQIVASTFGGDGIYSWTIPNKVSESCKVKITDVSNGSITDQSNSVFVISAEPVYLITVTSPNGGENWFVGNQYSITWNSVNVENLKLEYSVNDGNEWTQIVDSVPANLGSYIWTIPNTSSSTCKVRITSLENGIIKDITDSNFTISIAPSVALTSPNGGENWIAGKQYSITWTSINVQNLKIEYSSNNGILWNTIEGSTPAGPGSYIWTIPNSVSVECLVRLSGTDNSSVTDQSDQPFTIDLERNLTLVSPSGGEVFTSGEKMAITWNSLNLETIDLYYSVDNGGYWGLIADSVDASLSTFNWDIPENNSNQVKIRLVYTRKTELRSEIVNTFTILPSPKVTLQSNLSGAFLKSGANQLIEWFVENVSAVNLFYSSDGGTVWNEVALNVPSTTRSHNWVVPQLNSKNCRIKVVSSVNPDLSNSNAGYFTIYTYSESISLVNTWQFGDIKDITNYRLVSMPGNTTENLVNVISGKHIEEWNAYWDNGNDVNYQVQYDGSEIFKFQPGKGFWVLSKNPINLNKQLAAVTIDSTLIFNVSVHRGWNIIGNPFAKSLTWSEIRSINSLPQNRLIYYWDGKWNFPTQMEPFKGYYFFNEDNRSNLKFVYPVEASLAKIGLETQFQNITEGISISFGDNEIFAVFMEGATTGLDTNDYLLPGITFSHKNLSFLRDTEDGKKRQLFIESQPMDSLGNSFRIRASNTSGEAGHLQIKPRVDLGSNNIYLLDEKYQEFIDVRSKDKFTIIPQEESRYYTLLIGSDGFIKSVMAKYLPTEYILYQNYPNPFNPETSIKYALPEDSQVKIKLYDILGNEVITLFEGEEPAGVHTRTFDLSSFASGVYLYRLETRNKSFVKKMVLLR